MHKLNLFNHKSTVSRVTNVINLFDYDSLIFFLEPSLKDGLYPDTQAYVRILAKPEFKNTFSQL